jgi:hypothetical protein
MPTYAPSTSRSKACGSESSSGLGVGIASPLLVPLEVRKSKEGLEFSFMEAGRGASSCGDEGVPSAGGG